MFSQVTVGDKIIETRESGGKDLCYVLPYKFN